MYSKFEVTSRKLVIAGRGSILLLCTKWLILLNVTLLYIFVHQPRTCRLYQKSLLSLSDPEINDKFNSASALLGCQEISGCHTANLVNLVEEIFIG